MSAAVAVEGLGFRYPAAGTRALDDVTLSAQPGEVLAVVGPSGSGKSTLLRLVCGLALPDAGRVVIAGTDVTNDPPERRPVAMVFQGFALYPHLTVRDNIAFGPVVRREPRAQVARRVSDAAEALGIIGLLDRLPSALSGGERQRTALARALVRDPVVFCLDEPLSSLDPVLRGESRRMLAGLLRAEGRCAIYVTHDQAEAMTVGDRIAVLCDGRLEQVGTPRDVYDQPATTFVASFVGTPPMSLLPQADGTRLGIRAEDVVLKRGRSGLVVDVEDLGHEQHVDVQLADGAVVVARVPPGRRYARGDRVGVELPPERLVRFDTEGRASS